MRVSAHSVVSWQIPFGNWARNTGGDALLTPAATRSLIARYLARPERAEPPTSGRLATLTDREREILVLVAAGLTNDDIAARHQLSPHTVKTHVNRTMAKLGAHDRAQLVVIAYETGLVRPGRPGDQGSGQEPDHHV